MRTVIDPGDPVPFRNWSNRWRLRRFVRAQHRRDRTRQQMLGFDTFAEDWARLMARPPPAATRPVRTVWMLWLQGEQSAPALVRACMDSWREHNPGWTVRVLDAEAAQALVQLPDLPRHTSPNHAANLIRLRLLCRHGGVWSDATNLCRRPLDDWIDRAAATGFFAFARPQPVRALANWFIAAQPGHPLLEAWSVWSEAYVLSGRKVDSYFWSHHTFDWLLETSPQLGAAWQDVPSVSARGPHILQRLLDGHVTPEDEAFRETFAQTPLFKLNWKKGYTCSSVAQAIRQTLSR